MAFTEFCCRSGGSNMNGGALNSNGQPATTPVYSATNGNWTSTTGVYIPVGGSTTGITVGDFAHVFTDGSTTPTFIGRVTAISAGVSFTVSTTAKAGTAPTTAATGVSVNVGGAWAGPSGTTLFPITFIDGQVTPPTNSAGDKIRINYKNDQTYSMTASIVLTKAAVKHQGYTTTFGDGGRATIDGGTSGASYILWNVANVPLNQHEDLIFQNNGATGSADLVALTLGGNAFSVFRRCVFAHARGNGLLLDQGTMNLAIECEAYDCNQSNTANKGGIHALGVYTIALRCYSHDHNVSNSNAHAFVLEQGQAQFSIADTCGGAGFAIISNAANYKLIGNDAYNCTGGGIKDLTGGGNGTFYIENCNLVKNGGWGINILAAGMNGYGYIVNCGFVDNVSGNIQTPSAGNPVEVVGSVIYTTATTPYNAPTTGDFRITGATAKGGGRGNWTQTGNSKTGSLGWPDIGAVQHQDAGGSSGPVAQLKSFGRGAPY